MLNFKIAVPREREQYARWDEQSCTIDALAHYLNESWLDVKELVQATTNYTPWSGCREDYYHKLLLSLGFRYESARVRLTSKTAAARLPRRAILRFGRHVCYYEEGTVLDNFYTASLAGCKQTRGYWYIPDHV